MDYVVEAVTDRQDKLLSPEAPMRKLCNPPTCYHCVKKWLYDSAHHISAYLLRAGDIGQVLR